MRAAICAVHGGPETVSVGEVPTPELTPDQIRVAVVAAAVNFPDVLIVADRYQVKVEAPFVPGSEFAGVVIEVGADVREIAIGERVTCTGIVGAFAEEATVRSDSVKTIPAGVDSRVAAAFGVAHRTAYHCLRSLARVRRDDAVVVLGAGGGVGLAAVQLAVRLGAEVIAVASSDDKLAAARLQGATNLINHRSTDLRSALRQLLPNGARAVLDPVGGDLSEPALRSLGRGGRFVTIGYASGVIPHLPLNLVLVKGIHILGFQFQDLEPDELARNESELDDMLADGLLAPHIGATFSLDDTAQALRLVADGKAVGKVLIEIGSHQRATPLPNEMTVR